MMNLKQTAYISAWLVMLGFMAASAVTGQLWYLIGSSICMTISGIADISSNESTAASRPSNIWQIVMAIYLTVLAVFLLNNIDFVRSAGLLTFALFALPYIPFIIQSERKKFSKMGDKNNR
jgi:uncharacterized membrane protein YqaE (UPF0057 family)